MRVRLPPAVLKTLATYPKQSAEELDSESRCCGFDPRRGYQRPTVIGIGIHDTVMELVDSLGSNPGGGKIFVWVQIPPVSLANV